MIQTGIGGGQWLSAPAAASYLRMRAAGCPSGVTEAGRTYTQQVQMYAAYLAGHLVATAAKPGTSKHETGRALDLPEPARGWVRAHGAEYGWVKDRVPREPWHMEYELARDQHLNETPAPLETIPEDDMYTDADRARDTETHAMLGAGGAAGMRSEDTIGYRVRDTQLALTTALPEIKADTWDIRLALSNAIPTLLADAARPDVDPAMISAAIVSAIPASLAQAVLDGLARRLTA